MRGVAHAVPNSTTEAPATDASPRAGTSSGTGSGCGGDVRTAAAGSIQAAAFGVDRVGGEARRARATARPARSPCRRTSTTRSGGPGAPSRRRSRSSGAGTGHGSPRRTRTARSAPGRASGGSAMPSRSARSSSCRGAASATPARACAASASSSPVKRGGRFSKKAAMPSARSSVVEMSRFRSDSSRSASASVRSRPRCTASRAAACAPRCAARSCCRERVGTRLGIGVEHREPAAPRRVGVDRVADHQHPQRERDAAAARQPLRAAPARQLAVTDLGERHRRRGSDDAEIGREQQLRAGADRRAVPHRDRRRGERRQHRRRIAQARGRRRRAARACRRRRARGRAAHGAVRSARSSSCASRRPHAGPDRSASGPGDSSTVATAADVRLRLSRRRARARRPPPARRR